MELVPSNAKKSLVCAPDKPDGCSCDDISVDRGDEVAAAGELQILSIAAAAYCRGNWLRLNDGCACPSEYVLLEAVDNAIVGAAPHP